jgi:hypothetical protein
MILEITPQIAGKIVVEYRRSMFPSAFPHHPAGQPSARVVRFAQCRRFETVHPSVGQRLISSHNRRPSGVGVDPRHFLSNKSSACFR